MTLTMLAGAEWESSILLDNSPSCGNGPRFPALTRSDNNPKSHEESTAQLNKYRKTSIFQMETLDL